MVSERLTFKVRRLITSAFDSMATPVLPYVSPSRRDPGKRLQTIAAMLLVFVIVGTAVDVAMCVRAVGDWRDVDRVVRSRDPARRIIKAIERGRPGVYPSRGWLAAFLIDQSINIALNLALGYLAWRCVVPGADPVRIWPRVTAIAWAKLALLWLGPVAAIGFGSNLSRVRNEFEVLGDWRHFHVWTHGLLAVAAAAVWGLLAVIVLRGAPAELDPRGATDLTV
jgi:hypothetical protein